MAYPTLGGSYGLIPVNLIGGQVFAGSTRMIPIANNYTTSMFFGDAVQLTATGTAIISSLAIPTTSQAAQTVVPGTVGVFLGCEYTPGGGPLYGKMRSQFWNGTIANGINDAVAYVCDDPDAIFKTAVLSMPAASTNTATALTSLGYMSPAFVGTNAYYVGANVGSTATGNATSGVVGNTAGASNGAGNVRKDNTTAAAMRIVGVVPETAVTVATTGTCSTTSLTVASTTGVFPGMQVIIPGATAGAGGAGFNTYVTAVTSSTAVTISASVTAASTTPVTFVGYQEVLVKWNFGYHSYYNATQIA